MIKKNDEQDKSILQQISVRINESNNANVTIKEIKAILDWHLSKR